jgi:glycosyltransferase involved in cell wall biosynthesis
LADSAFLRPDACAFIRLILPLTQQPIRDHFQVRFVRLSELEFISPSVVVIQRLVASTEADFSTLMRCVRRTRAQLIYEIDDDLLSLDRDHPEQKFYESAATGIKRIMAVADQIWVSTESLRERYAELNSRVAVVQNNLDRRIWSARAPRQPRGEVRVLYMGTSSHMHEFTKFVVPAARSLRAEFGDRVSVSIIGVLPEERDTAEALRIPVPPHIAQSYPAFAVWLQSLSQFDIGVAPLVSNKFNQSKSYIKWLEYSALGCATLASAVGEYTAALKNGSDAVLVAPDEEDFQGGLRSLVLDDSRRSGLANAAHGRVKSMLSEGESHNPRFELLAELVGLNPRIG